jgi:hypothetical protein
MRRGERQCLVLTLCLDDGLDTPLHSCVETPSSTQRGTAVVLARSRQAIVQEARKVFCCLPTATLIMERMQEPVFEPESFLNHPDLQHAGLFGNFQVTPVDRADEVYDPSLSSALDMPESEEGSSKLGKRKKVGRKPESEAETRKRKDTHVSWQANLDFAHVTFHFRKRWSVNVESPSMTTSIRSGICCQTGARSKRARLWKA